MQGSVFTNDLGIIEINEAAGCKEKLLEMYSGKEVSKLLVPGQVLTVHTMKGSTNRELSLPRKIQIVIIKCENGQCQALTFGADNQKLDGKYNNVVEGVSGSPVTIKDENSNQEFVVGTMAEIFTITSRQHFYDLMLFEFYSHWKQVDINLNYTGIYKLKMDISEDRELVNYFTENIKKELDSLPEIPIGGTLTSGHKAKLAELAKQLQSEMLSRQISEKVGWPEDIKLVTGSDLFTNVEGGSELVIFSTIPD